MPSSQVKTYRTKIHSFVDRNYSNGAEQKWWHDEMGTFFANIAPYSYPDCNIIEELLSALKKNDSNKIDNIRDLSYFINTYRVSQAFSFVPQLSINELDELKQFSTYENGQLNYDVGEIKNAIMNGLKLSYNPKLPIEPYLDLMIEKKGKISNIVSKIYNSRDLNNEKSLSNLQTEIQDINYEVKKLQSSTRAMTVDLLTNFATKNKSIITGAIIAASMGLAGVGVIGCGASLASGFAAKVISKKSNIKMPEVNSRLKDRFNTFLEPAYEDLLARAFSSDLIPVQVWQIRKRLKELK